MRQGGSEAVVTVLCYEVTVLTNREVNYPNLVRIALFSGNEGHGIIKSVNIYMYINNMQRSSI